MRRQLRKRALLICTGIMFLLPLATFSRVVERRNKSFTKLRVVVTGGRQSVPVVGADVLVKSLAEGEAFEDTVPTDSQGVANVSEVPLGTVLIQVTALGWTTSTGQYELNKKEQTIPIQLKEVEEKPTPTPTPPPTPTLMSQLAN